MQPKTNISELLFGNYISLLVSLLIVWWPAETPKGRTNQWHPMGVAGNKVGKIGTNICSSPGGDANPASGRSIYVFCLFGLIYAKSFTQAGQAGRGEDAMVEGYLRPLLTKSVVMKSKRAAFQIYDLTLMATHPLRNLLKWDNFRIWKVAVLGKSRGSKSDLPG